MEVTYSKTVKLYDVLEIVCKGKADGNPFVDYSISAAISGADSITVKGFYDGNGTYIVRYMPQKEGEYSFKIIGSFSDETAEGSFKVERFCRMRCGQRPPAHRCKLPSVRFASGTDRLWKGT